MHWVVSCDGCLTEEEWSRGYYWIDAGRISTVEDALHWTVHLAETKGWLAATDWFSLMRSVPLLLSRGTGEASPAS